MKTWPHLPRAPITEALIDLRVDLPEDISLERLGTMHEEVSADYPNKRDRIEHHAALRLTRSEGAQLAHQSYKVNGFVFESVDGTQVVQARLDGFTFNRLKPYETWEHLRDEARALWNTYEHLAKPTRIKRIALRYINKIELPLPMGDFGDWLQTLPAIDPRLPQQIAGYFMRLLISFEEQGISAILTQTIEPVTTKEHLPIVFDIDVFQEDPDSSSLESMWSRFEVLRDVKNEIFFNSVTERTLDLYR